MMRKLAAMIVGVCVLGGINMGQAIAIPCGIDECEGPVETNASPYSIGDLGTFNTTVGFFSAPQGLPGPNTPFWQAWSFTLNQEASIGGTLTNDNVSNRVNIVLLTLELFTAGNTQVNGSFVVPPGNNNPFTFFAFRELAAGDYLFKVFGTIGPNSDGGQYTGNFNISQVPLPPAIWLFVTAILGLVSAARIRRRETAA